MNPTPAANNPLTNVPSPSNAASPGPDARAGKNRWLIAVLLAALALLACFSVYLSQSRIYQVDECQNLYMARVLASGQSSQYFTTYALFLFGPLSWISQSHLRSAEMFAMARLLFLAVLWFSLVLLAAGAGGRLGSRRGLIALIAAFTLAPLWDYGFEIRHDNLVVAGVLLAWWAIRVRPMGIVSFALAGATTIVLLFIAVKSVVYIVPLSGAALLFPPPGHNRPRWQLALAWIAGALLALALVRVCYGTGDAWEHYLSIFRGVSKYSTKGGGSTGRFWPWETLARLLTQTPLLLALTTAGLATVTMDLLRRKKAALTWNGILPETLLLLGSLAALMANPNPFAYNLVHVVPYAFLFGFKYAAELLKNFRAQTSLWPVLAAIFVLAHLVPFSAATRRHLDFPNSRQKELMRLAEDLTDPAKDAVYDAIGMVPTRPSIDYHWYLHTLNAPLMNLPGNRVREILAARPASVLIQSYRTDWLAAADHEFIEQQYVPIADDFRVLGTVLNSGGGSFEIVHPGRYGIVPRIGSGRRSPVIGKVDGAPLSGQPIYLAVGTHRIETVSDCQPEVVWIGPNLDRLPPLSENDHRFLFVNWY